MGCISDASSSVAIASRHLSVTPSLEVAAKLLDACTCCLDTMLSGVLRTMAMKAADDREGRTTFLMSQFVQRIILVWSETEEMTVFDLECVNGVIGRVRVAGRCPDFATLAAKVYIREFISLFERLHGSRPYDAYQAAHGALVELAKEAGPAKPGPAKGKKTAYGEFCSSTSRSFSGETSLDKKADLFDSNLVRGKWAQVPHHEKLLWQQQADKKNAEVAPGAGAAQAAPPQSALQGRGSSGTSELVQLVGDTASFLTEKEFALVHRFDTWEAHESKWTVSPAPPPLPPTG